LAAARPAPKVAVPPVLIPKAKPRSTVAVPRAKPKPTSQQPQERLSWLRLPWWRR
jgi:hypothetical protein